jgi:sugar phosphate isomerase/epimerase
MYRLGACTWIYGEAPLDEILARIAGAGCEGVELLGEPDRWPAGEIRRLLARHHLEPLALTASCKVPETRRDLAHPDAGVRADAVAHLVQCLRLAAEIGAPLVQMLPSGESRLVPIATREQEWRWSVEGMRAGAREAERLGVRIAVEPLNRYEAYLVTTMDEALAYLDDVGSAWVGMTFDVFHAHLEERDPVEALGAGGRRVWHVHLADTNRRALGRGHLDVPRMLAALRQAGYEGALVLEVVPTGADASASDAARAMQIVDGYVRESIAALRAHLANV